MLLAMIDKATLRDDTTLITADAGYYSDDNVRALHERGIPALVADNGMRQRDERIDNAHHKAKGEVLHDKRTSAQPIKLYRPEHFSFHADTATCPAGKTLTSNGSIYTHPSGARVQQFKARDEDCRGCELKHRCLRKPDSGKGRSVSLFGRALVDDNDPGQKMRQAIDSPQGRALYSRRIATVEPVFANIRHHKRMSRFTLRGKAKVSTQWQLYSNSNSSSGAAAQAGRQVTVHYNGWLHDPTAPMQRGRKFDSSKDRNDPFKFDLGEGMVIAGWDEGVQGMQVGGKRVLVIPPDLGYGARGAGGVIPPNATLVFEVELLGV
jgi:FKBP-type peptidyl-prolyl cis-trans isomerase